MTTASRHHMIVTVATLLLTWVVAGVANAVGFIMGYEPTAVGVVATLVAVCGWLAAGWFAGSRSEASFLRFATILWTIVVVGGPFAFWALEASPGMSATQGGLVLPLLLFVLVAPLYGLYALLPLGEPIVQSAVVGVVVFVMTLVAYYAARRIGAAAE